MSIRAKLLGAIAICAGAFVAFALLAWNTVNATKVTGSSYQAIVERKDLVADILPPPEFIVEPYLTAYQLVDERDVAKRKELRERLKTLKSDFDDRHRFWSQALAAGELRDRLLETSYGPAVRFFDILEADFVPAIDVGQPERARLLLREKLEPLYRTHRQAIEQVVSLANASLSSTETSVKALVSSRALGLTVLAMVVLAAMLVTALWIHRLSSSIIGRLAQAGKFAGGMAAGNMTLELDPGQDDEVGQLIRALGTMKASVRGVLVDIRQSANTLSSTSTSLLAVSSQTATNVAHMSDMANTVAGAAEESSATTAAMTANIDRTATIIESVTKSTEEMSATISEIAKDSAHARAIAEQASAQAQDIHAEMRLLGQAAQDIDKVTEVIKGISAQTSLLALNATIEAARAGNAGKGFAVVAGEIKELAQQAAAASEDIKAKVASVQSSSAAAISNIERIATVVRDVSGIVIGIATAVEEQSVVTRDVAGNVSQASAAVQDTARQVGETASASQSIARDVSQVSRSANEIRQGGKEVEARANDLAKLAGNLTSAVGRFTFDAESSDAVLRP